MVAVLLHPSKTCQAQIEACATEGVDFERWIAPAAVGQQQDFLQASMCDLETCYV